nr:hypothetical protein [Oscillospiraceae bacterium]
MNLFEYVPLMKEMSSPVAILGVVVLALFLIIIIFKMFGGMRRGGWRQLVRTGMTLLAAVASYIIAVSLSGGIIGSLDTSNLEGLISSIDGFIAGSGDVIRDALSSINSELIEYIFLLPATLILIPILTTAIFLLINLILKIARAVIIKIVGFKKAKNNAQRLGGALLAAIESIIWITMVILPISGVLGLVDEAYCEAIEAAEGEEKAVLESTYDEYLLPLTKNPAICFVNALGAEVMSDGIATVDMGGQRTNMKDEVLGVAHLILVDAGSLDGADFSALTEDNKTAISSIVDTLSQSPFMSKLLVGLLQGSAGAIENGFIPIQMGDEYKSLFSELLAYLGGITEETFEADLNTIKELYFTVSDSGVLTAAQEGGDIMALLQEQREQGDDSISKLITILQSNSRTAPMVKALTEALISSLSSGVELEGGVSVTYDELKGSMNDVLAVKPDSYATEEEYKEALSDTLDSTLRNYGIELESEIVDSIADYIDTEYSEILEFSDEEFNDVLLHYYDAYLNYIEGGELPDVN